MAATFMFYRDSGLTQPYSPGDQLGPVVSLPQDYTVYLGSVDATVKLQAKSNAGTDPVVVTLADVNGGSGVETTDIVLGTTQLELDGNAPGSSLDLPAIINGGVGNQVEVWVRVQYAGGTISDADVSLQLSGDESTI